MTHDGTPDGDNGTALPAEVREALGRRLRSELRIDTEKPAFLGDDALPPRFAGLVRKIEEREELPSRTGIHAIRQEFGLPDEDN